MLSHYDEGTRHRLLNVATGASIVDDFPELSGHAVLGYAEGLLALVSAATFGVRLFNPFTRAVTDLPVFSLWSDSAYDDSAMLFCRYKGFSVIDGGSAAAEAPTVVLLLAEDWNVPMVLAFIRPGESHWSLADTSALTCRAHRMSVLSLHGRFYLSTSTGDVLTVELHPVPWLVPVVRRTATTTVPAIYSSSLAPSGDGAGILMIMVYAHVSEEGEDEDDDHGEQVDVFEVDVNGQKLIRTSTVGADCAVFLGLFQALSFSTKVFPSISASANSVYFCCYRPGRADLFHVFHIDNGRFEPAVEIEFFEQMPMGGRHSIGPFNLDFCLAHCVDSRFLSLACCVDVGLGTVGSRVDIKL